VIRFPGRRGLILAAVVPLILGTTLTSELTNVRASSLSWKNCVNGTSAGGWCSIENLAHTLCLGAVASGDGTNGDAVELVRCPYVGEPIAQKEAETWTYLQSDFGGITAASLVNFAHYLCLDANNNGSGQNGDKVQLWHCLDQPNQGWGLDAPPNSNEIPNYAHFLCLDANQAGDGSIGDKVQLWSCWDGKNQQWAAGP